MRRSLIAVVLIAASVLLAANLASSATPVSRLYNCVNTANPIQRTGATDSTVCKPGWSLVYWNVTEVSVATTTTAATTTTVGATTTVATTTPTTQPTTTTTQPAGAFLSYPHQSSAQSFTGSNVEVSQRSYVGFTSTPAVTVTNATNVYLHDLDFDTDCGGIYLSHVSGTLRIENVRFRNIGGCGIGSGHSNAIQLADSFVSGGIRNNQFYGGHTEDVFSIYKSGGVDSSHVLVIENNHLESPLTGTLAWTSNSGTCSDLADYGGHDILYQNNTLLNCGQVGIQMHQPGGNVVAKNNIVYGAARTGSNVGLSQWSATGCSPCVGGNAFVGNRVFWQRDGGAANPWFLSGTYPVTIDAQSKTQDASTPQVHVSL